MDEDINYTHFILIRNQIENYKTLILNMLILMKNLNRIDQLRSHVRLTRLLATVLTDILKNYVEIQRMNINSLGNDELDYINDSFENFSNMVINGFRLI